MQKSITDDKYVDAKYTMPKTDAVLEEERERLIEDFVIDHMSDPPKMSDFNAVYDLWLKLRDLGE